MSKNNRTAGHNFEREIRKWWRARGWRNCTTSRYSSREKDDNKIDLCYTDPYNVQCKYTQNINMHKELGKMPAEDNLNLIFHKKSRQGTVVAMGLEDFEELLLAANYGLTK